MFDPKALDDLARSLSDAVPAPLRGMQAEVQKQFRAVLEAGFARLNLVTREEFEVQTQVLARTREKLEALERQVAALEAAGKPAA